MKVEMHGEVQTGMHLNPITGGLDFCKKDGLIIKIKLEDINIRLPQKAHTNDACYDVCASKDTLLNPFEPTFVETGIAFEIPNDYYLQMFSRSGLSSKGIILLNSVGIIDPNFRGYIKAPLMNLTKEPYEIKANDRIVQIGLTKKIDVLWKVEEELSNTNRGTNGFGSSGN